MIFYVHSYSPDYGRVRPTSVILGSLYVYLLVAFGITVAYIASRPAPREAPRKKSAGAENGKAATDAKTNGVNNTGFEIQDKV